MAGGRRSSFWVELLAATGLVLVACVAPPAPRLAASNVTQGFVAAGLPVRDVTPLAAEPEVDGFVDGAAWVDQRAARRLAERCPACRPEPGVLDGGVVEVFERESDRRAWQDWLETTTQARTLGTERQVGVGPVLLRLSPALTTAEVQGYRAALLGVVEGRT